MVKIILVFATLTAIIAVLRFALSSLTKEGKSALFKAIVEGIFYASIAFGILLVIVTLF